MGSRLRNTEPIKNRRTKGDLMNQRSHVRHTYGWTRLSFCLVVLLFGAAIGSAEEAPGPPPLQDTPPLEGGDVQERGVTKGDVGNLKDKMLQQKPQPQQGGTPPPQLCHTETRMMTQCKCFNQAECQALSVLFPNPCPPGSQHCEFVPMARGTLPPLPPNLCGYQVPWTFTQCSCHNQTECQLLSPFCPGSCPAGSQSCNCTPLHRGN